MEVTYEELREGMKERAVVIDRESWKLPIHGVKHILPLEGREIPVVIYSGKPNGPVLFCCFGGGFITGNSVRDDALWNELGEKLGATMVSIEYRKSPEYQFPCALWDVYDSIAYVEAHHAELGIDSEDWSVFGCCAGANLATAVCMLDIRRGNKLGIRRQILNYPYLDLATKPAMKGHPEVESMVYRLFSESYCGNWDAFDPLVSPVYAGAELLAKLPRTIITLAESDPLHAEGARYASRLRAAGVQVDCTTAADMPHGYMEGAYQEPGPYLGPKATEQRLNGSFEREKNKAFEFIKEHF